MIAHFALALLVLLQLAAIVRALLRRHREPAARIAWVVVLISLPIVGLLAYVLLGEVSIGRHWVQRMRSVLQRLPRYQPEGQPKESGVRAEYEQLFRLGESISHFAPVAGNSASILPDSNAGIDSIVHDIDAAQHHVHLLFYIWLTDNNGLKIVEAVIRAAQRGVACRVMADGLGSRVMIESEHWKRMRDGGVRVGVALPLSNPLLRPFSGRVDCRNHRKIVVIDHRISYCGSQNCADPEFRVKAKFAPWVDILLRFEGPISRQNQYVFVSDWMTYMDESLESLLGEPLTPGNEASYAQVVATGPTVRFSSMPEMFEALMHSAHRELTITTPYYVPNESMQTALCSAAYRGVKTSIVFPKNNDSWIVAAASRSYYADLLEAGVQIFEYPDGLLHAKTLTVDGELALIGSANMDRRSFDLNYENNVLLHDVDVTKLVRQRQQTYLDDSEPVTMEQVREWPVYRRLWNNTVAMLGPVL